MTIPVYLLECHTWSDGEDDHEEDHNSYYDMKFFYLVDSDSYKCIYSWHVGSDPSSGLVMEVTELMNLCELDDEKIPQGEITREKAKEYIRNYLAMSTPREQRIKDVALDFLSF